MTQDALSQLPPSVRQRLDALCASLTATLGENLRALVVHGSAARGGWRENASDVDLVCVLRDDAGPELAAIGPALELARNAARIETMILREDEIARASDCFPLLYGDLARRSVTVAGKSPFEGLVVEDRHTRLRIEQELREIRIRARRVVTDMASTAQFAGAVERKVKQLRAPLWALLHLRGQTVSEDLPSVLAASATAYGLDLAPLARVREDAPRAYAALTALLDAALADVDARDEHTEAR